MSKRNKKNKVPTVSMVPPTIGQIVKCYNKLNIASITWSRKEERLKLYQNILTPVTAEWINEIFIISKQGVGQYLAGPITVKTLKEMKDIMLEFDDFFKNSDENLDEESRKYFDLPLDDDNPINEDVMKDFLEEWDDGEIIDV